MDIWIPKNCRELNQHLHNPLFANAYFLMAITAIGSLFGFIFWMIVARYYSPCDVGFATAFISAMGLVAGFSKIGLDIGLIRYIPNEKDKSGLINSCLTITILLSIVLATAFIMSIDLWSSALSVVRENIVFSLCFITFTTVTAILVVQYNIFIAFRKAKFSFIQNTVWMVLKVPLSILLVTAGAFGIFVSWGIAMSIALIISMFVLMPMIHPEYHIVPAIKKRVVYDMFHFSFGNYIAGIFTIVPQTILPLLIVNTLGAEMTAYFYIVWMIAMVLFEISRAATMSLFAEGSHFPDQFRKDIIKCIKFIFILLIPTIIGVFIMGDQILQLFGKEYSENGFELLLILTISSIPVAINQLYITVKRVQMKIKPVIYLSGFVALFTLIVGYGLMVKIGLTGVGYAWVVGNVIVMGVVGLEAAKTILPNIHKSERDVWE